MNIDKKVTQIVYETVKTNQKRFQGVNLEMYDNWKDDIIEKIQEYITQIFPGYEYTEEIQKTREKLK